MYPLHPITRRSTIRRRRSVQDTSHQNPIAPQQMPAVRSATLWEGDVRKAIVDELIQRNKSLYGDEDFADLVLQCGGRTFNVHKAVVCAGCEFFRAACRKNETGGFKEGLESKIILGADVEQGGDDPMILAMMLEYLYSTDYTTDDQIWATLDPPSAEESRILTAHAKVFAIADKYNIVGLKMLARQKFDIHLENTDPKAFSTDIAEAIRTIFTSTPESVTELRDSLKAYLISADADLTKRPEVKLAVESIEGLAYALFEKAKEKTLIRKAPSEDLGTGPGWLFDDM